MEERRTMQSPRAFRAPGTNFIIGSLILLLNCYFSLAIGNDALATSPIPAINLRLLDNPTETDTFSTTTTTIDTSALTTTELPTTVSRTDSVLSISSSTPTTTPFSYPLTSTFAPSISISNNQKVYETTTSDSPTTTTMESVTTLYAFNRPFSLFSIAARSMECEYESQSYSVGDAMPSDQSCSQCYCASNGERICKLIHCSLPGNHSCYPIIPEGHCCPIEYRCETPGPSPILSKELLKPDQSRSRSLEQFRANTLPKAEPLNSYPNLNRVVNLLSSFISEIHREPNQNINKINELPQADPPLTREMRSDAYENVNEQKISAGNGNTFANGWKAIRNKNKFRSNPNRLFKLTTEKPKTTIATTIASSTMNENPITPTESALTNISVEVSSTTEDLETTEIIPANTQQIKKNNDFLSTSRCVVNGKEYSNGEILPKSASNPCNYCRCFYGKEICQEQQCPSPPSSDCVSETVEGQCCPTFTCRSSDSDILSLKPQIRHGPQYEPEIDSQSTKNEPSEEIEARVSQPFQQLPVQQQQVIPQLQEQQQPPRQTLPSPPHRLSFPMDSLPRPIEQLLFMGSRIHFPKNGNPLPGLRLPANLPPQVIMNMHKNALNKNAIRPHFRQGQIVPSHIIPIHHQFQKHQKESPIRTLPQSPIQIPSPSPNDEPQESELEPSLPKNSNEQNSDGINIIPSSTPAPSTSTTTTTEKNPWDIFKISGCNIYGKVYRAGEKIDKLSDKCKQCVCSSQGVECNNTCQ